MKYFTAAALLGLTDAMHFGLFGCPTIADDNLSLSSFDTSAKAIVDAGSFTLGSSATNFPASFLGTKICENVYISSIKDDKGELVNYQMEYGYTDGWNTLNSKTLSGTFEWDGKTAGTATFGLL